MGSDLRDRGWPPRASRRSHQYGRRKFPLVRLDTLTHQLCRTRSGLSPEAWQTPILIQTSFRSEEHTSELQSLMRISYAVFCLKKKKDNNRTHRRAAPSQPPTSTTQYH